MRAAAAPLFVFVQAAITSTAGSTSNLSTMARYSSPSSFSRDPFAIAHALSAASPSRGSHLHAQALKLGMSADTFTMNHLLMFYSRRGLLGGALGLFDGMPHRNLVSWTAMVSASIRSGAPELGFGLFVSMMRSGFCPTEFALASTLGTACQSMDHVKLLGLSLHGVAVKVGLDGNPFAEKLTYGIP